MNRFKPYSMLTDTDIRRHSAIIATVLLAVFSISTYAQDSTLIARLHALLSSGNRISATYCFDIDGTIPMNGLGTVVVQGRCFRLDSGKLQILGNGESIYTMDAGAKELYIESAAESNSRLANPEQFIGGMRELKMEGTSVSGSVEAKEGQKTSVVHFNLEGVQVSAPSADSAEFTPQLEELEKEGWVITDLR
ncbi:MAG: hypothetical protein J5764_05345 [Bacteroidales bacterium]|nr:hypothetical protein [Bacteroidales bacterium]